MVYRKDIDGLRAVAVMLVVVFHVGLGLPGGFIGVDIFFVISGYLITGIVQSGIKDGSFTYTQFYSRRIRRLLPAFILVLLCTTVVAYLTLLPDDLIYYSVTALSSLLGVSNLFFAMLSGGYFAPRADLFPLLHTWSLSVEEQFYLFWPSLLLVFSWLTLRWRNLTVILMLAIFSIVSIVGSLNGSSSTYYLVQYRAIELLIGASAALFYTRIPSLSQVANNVISCIATGLIICLACTLDRYSTFPGVVAIVLSLAVVVLIISGHEKNNGFINRCLSLRVFVFIGLISYSMYLWHWPIISLLKYRQVEITPLHGVLIIIATMVLATLTFFLVENPVRKSQIYSFKKEVAVLFAFPLVVLSIFGGLAYATGGIPQRYDPEIRRLVQSYSTEKDLSRTCSTRKASSTLAKANKLKTNCKFGNMSNEPSILLYGDSHANHFREFVGVLANSAGRSAVYLVKGSCTSIEGMSVAESKDLCHVRNRHVVNLAENYEFVVLAGSWSTEKSIDRFHSDMTAALDGIIAAGAIPVVLIDSPSTHQDLSKCELHFRLGWKAKNICDHLMTEVEFKHGIYDKQLRVLHEERNDFILIDTKQVLCDDRKCVTTLAGVAVYRDRTHLNDKASSVIGEMYLNSNPNPFQ